MSVLSFEKEFKDEQVPYPTLRERVNENEAISVINTLTLYFE